MSAQCGRNLLIYSIHNISGGKLRVVSPRWKLNEWKRRELGDFSPRAARFSFLLKHAKKERNSRTRTVHIMNNYALAYTRGSFSLAFPVFPSQFPNTRVVFKPTQPTTILISINFFLCFFLRLSMSINLHDDDEFFSPLLSEIRKWTGGELSCLKTSNSLRNKNFCLTNKKGRSRKEKLDSEFYFEARKSCILKSDKIKSLLEWFSIFFLFSFPPPTQFFLVSYLRATWQRGT